MTTDVWNQHLRRKPPSPGTCCAVFLELAIFSVLIYHQSFIGALLSLAYSWFSATWQVIKDLINASH